MWIESHSIPNSTLNLELKSHCDTESGIRIPLNVEKGGGGGEALLPLNL